MGIVRKCFSNVPLKDVTMERKRVEEFEESLYEDCPGFPSQNSLWKLSTFHGYKGLYIVG